VIAAWLTRVARWHAAPPPEPYALFVCQTCRDTPAVDPLTVTLILRRPTWRRETWLAHTICPRCQGRLNGWPSHEQARALLQLGASL
jgi:hypothetical protein